MLFCKDIEQKAVDTLCSYCKVGTKILTLIENKNYSDIDIILKKREDLFSNFQKIENYLRENGINIFQNSSVINLITEGVAQNEIIQKSSSLVINFYRQKLLQLSDSLNYIRKAQHSVYEHTLRKEV